MIFYDKTRIANLLQAEELMHWHRKGLLDEAQLKKALHNRQPIYKTTNVFIRAGVFVLTFIIASCALGLTALMLELEGYEFMMLFFGVILFFILYQMVYEQHHYRSGVDDALLYYGLSLMLGGILELVDIPYGPHADLFTALIIFPFLLVCAIAFLDRLLSALCFGCFLAIIFLVFIELGETAKLLMPFLLMGVSLLTYGVIRMYKHNSALIYWKESLVVVECLALLVLYASANYFVVRELSTSFFEITLASGEDIPLAWLWYVFTFIIPVVYIFRGLKEKDYIQLNMGLVLVAAAVGTIRYYHSVMPLELALVLGGIALILGARVAYLYLKVPQHGITAEKDGHSAKEGKEHMEALIIMETTNPAAPPVPEAGFEFGGGKFGGGGAGGSF